MLRTTNLLRAGCLVLMSVAGQNIVLAGGHHGGGNGGGGNHVAMGQSHGGQQFMQHNGSNQLSPRQNAVHGGSPVAKISHNGSNMAPHGMTGIKSSNLRPGSGIGSGMQHASGNSQHQPFNKMYGSNWNQGNHNGGWNFGNKYSSGSYFPGKSYGYPSGCWGGYGSGGYGSGGYGSGGYGCYGSGYGCYGSGYGCYGSGYGSYGNCYSSCGSGYGGYGNCYPRCGYGSCYGNYGYSNCAYNPGCCAGYTATVVQPCPVTTCQTTCVTTQVPQVTSFATAAVSCNSDMLPPSPAPYGFR
jgi:hypothetical protein